MVHRFSTDEQPSEAILNLYRSVTLVVGHSVVDL